MKLWEHPLVAPATAPVLAYLEEAYADRDPDFVYRKTLLHLFGDAAQREAQQDEITEQTLENTDIWRALYEFQKHGVKGIINRIAAHGGCVLADSVGLGQNVFGARRHQVFRAESHAKGARSGFVPEEIGRELARLSGWRQLEI